MPYRRVICTIDAHTEGTPERIVVSGLPPIPGDTMVEKNAYARDHLDHVRKLLVNEPRGHRNMCGSYLTAPVSQDASYGVLFLEPGGYATMCGHGTIAICKILVDHKMVNVIEPTTPIVLDTVAGTIRVDVEVCDGKAGAVTIWNVPSFLLAKDVVIQMPEYGKVAIDIAYGGNFYAILSAESVGLTIEPQYAEQIISAGVKLQEAINEQVDVHHPEEPRIDVVSFVQFYAEPRDDRATMRNVVVSPPAGIDRSPCGTGTSARMASLFARDELSLHEPFVHESILGGLFYGELVGESKVGPYDAVLPAIRGSAYIMGLNSFLLEDSDPYPEGFYMGKPGELPGFH